MTWLTMAQLNTQILTFPTFPIAIPICSFRHVHVWYALYICMCIHMYTHKCRFHQHAFVLFLCTNILQISCVHMSRHMYM